MIKFLQLDLKEDIIIIEIPRALDYEFINKDSKYLKVGDEEVKLDIPTLSKLEFICKGLEFTEDIAKELVFRSKIGRYKDYNYKSGTIPDGVLDALRQMYFERPLESFISAIKAYGYYWGENPYSNYKSYSEEHLKASEELFNQAKSKTFNLDNTYIFKHN